MLFFSACFVTNAVMQNSIDALIKVFLLKNAITHNFLYVFNSLLFY